MIDTSDLEWYINIEFHHWMTVAQVDELTERIHNIDERDYRVGTTEDEKVRITKDGDLGIILDGISDRDMPEVMRILTEYPIFICEIRHEACRKVFWKDYNAFTEDMLEVYKKVLIETANPLLTWQAWKEESGFNAWVEEVYDNDE